MAHIPDPEQEPASEFLGIPVTAEGKAPTQRQPDETAGRRDPRASSAMIPASSAQRYAEDMEPDKAPPESMADALARVGIVVTPEGKARAKKLLADAAAQRTPEALAQMRALVGLPPASAA